MNITRFGRNFNDCLVQSKEDRLTRFVHVRVPMRDGIGLSADVTLPAGEGPFPAILIRTPYDNSKQRYLRFARYFADHGYAFVAQDVRGRGDSEGSWAPKFNEGLDGYDTVEWIARQLWCTGRVGMMGGSYAAHVQWMAAREQPPHLCALSSTASPGKFMEYGNPYQNGVLSLQVIHWIYTTYGRTLQTSLEAYEGLDEGGVPGIDWPRIMYHLPLETMDEAAGFHSDYWRFCVDHPDLDEHWSSLRLDNDFSSLNVPVLHITGWHDEDLIPTTFHYEGMVRDSRASADQALIIGPWDHPGTRDPQRVVFGEDFGEESVVDLLAVQREFFDVHLKQEGNFAHNVRLFVSGENSWRTYQHWPPGDTQLVPYYLSSRNGANSLAGDGTLVNDEPGDESLIDSYIYDPNDPTPGWPDHESRWAPQDLSIDQRFAQRRDDVLVYTTAELIEPIETIGTPIARLFISSTVQDTDFFVTLSDVCPDGRALRISWNVMRARYRESLSKQALMAPGQLYKLEFRLQPVCNVFQTGHRIRVDIRSANFPFQARNLNTGEAIGKGTRIEVATQNIHGKSAILLPITA